MGSSSSDAARDKTLADRFRQRLNDLSEAYVANGAEDVSDDNVEQVVDNAAAIKQRMREKGPLRRLASDGMLLLRLVRDYWKRRYRRLPFWTVAAIVFSLLYVLNPVDLIPDAIPGVGAIDDALVLSACLRLVEKDLVKYEQWRQERKALAT
ncbi:YkvA family protein [Salisaeta longa]|uniref:YkvA family protein n=1 Tax=Salisaeta longa TaxID=503170 RepID=UPI000684B5E9|nr:YkvA family protein [Salisaeta longa]